MALRGSVCSGWSLRKGFSFCANMAEYISHPSTWNLGTQPPHTSTLYPLEPMDLGVSEQQTPLEEPPSSPELGNDEDLNSPPDPDVPYPDLAPVVFFCLKQTTSPRNWCIKMVCNPYPFRAAAPPNLFALFYPMPPSAFVGCLTGQKDLMKDK
ncbi:voltage-dependent T-type calcium channel subunit alpha-1H-like [Alligator mississippiensis]|uniref:Voltage-dependent T-type calcium channel subunit alpha-1H-like n=1 Tax=Alligator mississippiensis TaxID=8496 RepID=A0A151NHK7_ALLMI|nr:voltage-dependent T-type calcium channel subunit alpha-1H-like [Alligator mississippiensis]